MPFRDDNGDRVEKGDSSMQTRTVEVTDSASIIMDDFVAIDEILGTQVNGDPVDEGNDVVADAVQGTEDNEVDIDLYTGGGTDVLDTTTAQTGQTQDVTVVARGY